MPHRYLIRDIIRNSLRKAIREAIVVSSPKNEEGEETIMIRHAAGLVIQYCKLLHAQMPENLGTDYLQNGTSFEVNKNSKDTVLKLMKKAIAPGRSMTVVGRTHLGNNPSFFKAQFLDLCQDNSFYFSNEILDLHSMGDKTVDFFISGNAHGSSYKHVFMKTLFSLMYIDKNSFRSFQRPGDSANYLYLNRTKQELKDAFDQNIRPHILSLFNITENDLTQIQDNIGFESRVSSSVTIKDLESMRPGFYIDAAKCKNFYDLLKEIKDDYIIKEIKKANFSNYRIDIKNPIATSLYGILDDYYRHIIYQLKNFPDDFEIQADQANLDIEGFKSLLEQKIGLIKDYL